MLLLYYYFLFILMSLKEELQLAEESEFINWILEITLNSLVTLRQLC